jgi:hypothetical protein
MWKELAPVIPVDLERLNPVIPALWKELGSVITAAVERADSCYYG